MNARLGNIFYWTGWAGVAICVFNVIDAVSVYQSGRSFLPITGRFLSLQELLITLGISVVLAFLSWRVGKGARDFVNKAPTRRSRAKGSQR